MDTLVITLLIVTIFAGVFIQGLAGFGSSMMIIPISTLIISIFVKDASLSIKVIIASMIFINLVSNFTIYLGVRNHVNYRRVLFLFLGGAIFTFVGANFLATIDDQLLNRVLAVIIFIVAIMKLFDIRINIKKPDRLFFPVGSVSGFLNGLSGISGPPVLIFLSNLKMTKDEFRATIISYFFFMNIIAAISFAIKGLITSTVIDYSLILVPVGVLGGYIGSKVSMKLSEHVFNKVVSTLLIALAIMMFV